MPTVIHDGLCVCLTSSVTYWIFLAGSGYLVVIPEYNLTLKQLSFDALYIC